MKALTTLLRPSLYRRGRLAALFCGGYLLLVALSAGYVLWVQFHPDPTAVGASFEAIPLVILTAPLSFLVTPLLETLGAYDGWGVLLLCLFHLLLAVVQATPVYLALRGPLKDPTSGEKGMERSLQGA